MYLNSAIKAKIFETYGAQHSAKDTGSPESQIALWTYRIQRLTEHLKLNRKDKATQRGLMKLVGKRKRMLSYLEREDITRYRAILKELGLRG
jgi:small subunit ribosomal protein S15